MKNLKKTTIKPNEKSDMMKMLSELLQTIIYNLKIEDLPVNIRIKNQLYDIKNIQYEPEINEYIIELTEGYTYTKKPTQNTSEKHR